MLPLAVGVVVVLMLVDGLVRGTRLAGLVGVDVGSKMAMRMVMGMETLLAAVSGRIRLMVVGLLSIGMTSSLGRSRASSSITPVGDPCRSRHASPD